MSTEEILLIILTAAGALLAVALILAVLQLWKLLRTVQKRVDEMGDDPKNLIKNLSQVSADINCKLRCCDPIFRAVGNMGEGLEYKSRSLKERYYFESLKQRACAEEKGDKISDIAELVVSGIHLWNKIKK